MVQTVFLGEIKFNIHRRDINLNTFCNNKLPLFWRFCLGKYKLVVPKYKLFPSFNSFFIEENGKTVAVIDSVRDFMP